MVTWGTSPEDVLPINDIIPNPNDFDNQKKQAVERSLDYMGLFPGQKLEEVKIDTVFIGSCTNGRIEDLREVAKIMEGKKVKEGIRAMIVPGSGLVREQAEEEGIAQKLKEAGFEWRLAGCSMCLAMNPDQLNPKERCAATSNRNFEGRQGRGGRTHLMSPAMAAHLDQIQRELAERLPDALVNVAGAAGCASLRSNLDAFGDAMCCEVLAALHFPSAPSSHKARQA